jgi:hypothetical protein
VRPASRPPLSRSRRVFNLVVFVILVAVGGVALVPLYNWLHPAKTTQAATKQPTLAGSSPRPQPVTLQPFGVMFDDFHYTGSDDPLLQAHGWQIRTDPGGPGIQNTWTTAGVSFPTVQSAQGGQVMQLQLTSDGTAASTRQTELRSAKPEFFTGTYAARVYFTDGPAIGENGDHINEAFYAISAPTETQRYSELDYEYMPNGGWGSARPELDTTSWHSSKAGDRVYRPTYQRLHGWHTVMITELNGETAYYLDGKKLFSNGPAYSLHGPVDVAFSTWLIDLPFAGPRTWNMQVNWFYYQAGKALSLSDVNKAVNRYYANGTHYIDTLTPAARR